jgi:hypothetical protein
MRVVIPDDFKQGSKVAIKITIFRIRPNNQKSAILNVGPLRYLPHGGLAEVSGQKVTSKVCRIPTWWTMELDPAAVIRKVRIDVR